MREFTFWRPTLEPEPVTIERIVETPAAATVLVNADDAQPLILTAAAHPEAPNPKAPGSTDNSGADLKPAEIAISHASAIQMQLVNHAVAIPRTRRLILKDLFFEFIGGRTYFLIGPNGAGKSLFLKSLTKPACPTVQLSGSGDLDILYTAIRDAIVEEETSLGRFFGLIGVDGAIIEKWGLAAHAGSSTSKLSQGQKARTALAFADFASPCVLLLDEPTLGLDEAGMKTLQALLTERNRKGLLTIIASHELILFDEEAGPLTTFTPDGDHTNVSMSSDRVPATRAEVAIEGEPVHLVLTGSLPSIARRLIALQKARIEK